MCKGNYAHHVKEKMFCRLPKDMELQSVPSLDMFTYHDTPESGSRKELHRAPSLRCASREKKHWTHAQAFMRPALYADLHHDLGICRRRL
jgi:hypothetical protein